ncbi:hypothetical protein SLEP1_g56846 [Rubroshorea leprosula]|uniref:Uncharacterized protein n=1 Tax=Rubroshorea leprosula TaxID=152421 RepID=A0AAV5MKU4_9ROSI|nr:hypothetical protein SLEP1_g56846 [Rubroshorea leprosula]
MTPICGAKAVALPNLSARQQPTSKKRAGTEQCASDALVGGGGVALAVDGLVELWLPRARVAALNGAKGRKEEAQ